MGFITFCTWGTALLSLLGALTALFIPGWATRTAFVANGLGGYCSHELGLGLLWTLEVETNATGSSEDNDVCGDDIFNPSSLLWERTSCDSYPDWGACPDTYWLGMLALVSMCSFFSLMNFIAMSYRLCCGESSYAKFNSESQSFSKGPSCLTPKTAACYSIMSLLCAICALSLWFGVLNSDYASTEFRMADDFATTQGSICVDFTSSPQLDCVALFPSFTGTDCFIGSCIDGTPVASEIALGGDDCLSQCGSKAVSDYSFNISCVSVIGLILNCLFMFMQAQALSRGEDFDL